MRLILILLLVLPQLGVAEGRLGAAEVTAQAGAPASRRVVVRTHRGVLRHVGARATPYHIPTPAAAPAQREIGSLRGLRLRR